MCTGGTRFHALEAFLRKCFRREFKIAIATAFTKTIERPVSIKYYFCRGHVYGTSETS